MTNPAYTAKRVFRQLESVVARIGRDLEREYDRDPDADFLSPEWEDLRNLSATLVGLLDSYSHLQETDND